MDWPTWNDVGPLLVVLAGGLGVLWMFVRGLLWVFGKLAEAFRSVARDAANEVAEHLYAQLKNVEDGLNAIGDRLDRMDIRTETRLASLEARILEAVRGGEPRRPEAPSQSEQSEQPDL